jgi:Cys-rich repeat protein
MLPERYLRVLIVILGVAALGCGAKSRGPGGDDAGTTAGIGAAGGWGPQGGADAGPTGEVCGNQVCSARDPYCDQQSGTCVECLTNDQCQSDQDNPYCDPGNHECVQCLNSDQCGSGQTCDPQQLECRDTCTSSDQCADPALPLCHPDRQVCVECLQNTDCTDPASPYCAADGECAECLTDSDCVAPAVCQGWGRCR